MAVSLSAGYVCVSLGTRRPGGQEWPFSRHGWVLWAVRIPVLGHHTQSSDVGTILFSAAAAQLLTTDVQLLSKKVLN